MSFLYNSSYQFRGLEIKFKNNYDKKLSPKGAGSRSAKEPGQRPFHLGQASQVGQQVVAKNRDFRSVSSTLRVGGSRLHKCVEPVTYVAVQWSGFL
jgi:hypothetical protein